VTSVASAAQLAAMDKASGVFDRLVTPVIFPSFQSTPPNLRQAWWDGLLSSIVGAMSATIGEKAAQECCEDLYTRAKDFAVDRSKKPVTDISSGA